MIAISQQDIDRAAKEPKRLFMIRRGPLANGPTGTLAGVAEPNEELHVQNGLNPAKLLPGATRWRRYDD
jgi:hypothetical protein